MRTKKRRSRSRVRIALPGPATHRKRRRRARHRLRSRRSRAALAAGALILLVLALTLVPLETTETAVPGTCVWCGHFALADAILNVMMFAPLGFLLGVRRRAVPLRIWGALTMLAAVIEATQTFLPGRFPTVSDVVANSIGAALGLLLARAWKQGVPVHARGSPRLPLAAGLAAAVVIIGASILLLPSLPQSEWYGQWTADLGHYDRYDGEVLDARIGGVETPGQRMPDPEAARSAILDGERIDVQFLAGAGTPRLAPIFSIYDGMEREIFVLGGREDDLIVRIRRRASELRLRSPETLFAGSAAAPGDTARIQVMVRDGAVCVDLPGASCRSLAPPGRGWSLLLGAAPSNLLERIADGAWLALLFLPLGYGFRRHTAVYAGLGIAVTGLLTAAFLSTGVQPADWLTTLVGTGAGLSAGVWAGHRVPGRFRSRGELSPRL